MILDRDKILSIVPQLPREEVPIPEWGGSVFVRTMTGSERDKIEVEWEATKRVHFRARLAVATVCDVNGRNLFRAEDVPVLAIQPVSVLDRILEVSTRLNKFTKDDIEELEKNSETVPSVASASASPRVLA